MRAFKNLIAASSLMDICSLVRPLRLRQGRLKNGVSTEDGNRSSEWEGRSNMEPVAFVIVSQRRAGFFCF